MQKRMTEFVPNQRMFQSQNGAKPPRYPEGYVHNKTREIERRKRQAAHAAAREESRQAARAEFQSGKPFQDSWDDSHLSLFAKALRESLAQSPVLSENAKAERAQRPVWELVCADNERIGPASGRLLASFPLKKQ